MLRSYQIERGSSGNLSENSQEDLTTTGVANLMQKANSRGLQRELEHKMDDLLSDMEAHIRKVMGDPQQDAREAHRQEREARMAADAERIRLIKEDEEREAERVRKSSHQTFRQMASGRNWGRDVAAGYTPSYDEMVIGLLDSIDRRMDSLAQSTFAILRHLQSQTPESRQLQRKMAARVATAKRALEICEHRYRVDNAADSGLLKKLLTSIIVDKQCCDGRDPETLPYNDMLLAIELTKKKRERVAEIVARATPNNGNFDRQSPDNN